MQKRFDFWKWFERQAMKFFIDAEKYPEHQRPIIGLANGLRLGLALWVVILWGIILVKWFLKGS